MSTVDRRRPPCLQQLAGASVCERFEVRDHVGGGTLTSGPRRLPSHVLDIAPQEGNEVLHQKKLGIFDLAFDGSANRGLGIGQPIQANLVFFKKDPCPEGFSDLFFLSLDHLARGDWGGAGKSLENLSLLFQKKEGGWGKYSAFRADWERMMVGIQKEGAEGILEEASI